MNKKAKELDVDFIGGQGRPLSKQEQLSISAFIKQLKTRKIKKTKQKSAKSDRQSTK